MDTKEQYKLAYKLVRYNQYYKGYKALREYPNVSPAIFHAAYCSYILQGRHDNGWTNIDRFNTWIDIKTGGIPF